MFALLILFAIPFSYSTQFADPKIEKKAIIWDEYAKDSITKDLETINKHNYITKNIKRTLERSEHEDTINPRKIKRLEHDLAHNRVLKTYIQNLLKSFIKERRRLMQEDDPPQPDIPIELGVSKQQNDSEISTSSEANGQCNGNLCNEIENEKNLPSDVNSGVWSEEEYSASSDKEKEDTHDTFNGESDDLFPPKVPEIPIELGSAFQESEEHKVAEVECEKKKKPCQEPCSGNTNCPPDEAPPEPDIPIELGSARSELEEKYVINGDEEVTYIPRRNLPKSFILLENNTNSDNTNYYSGSGESDYEPAQKRSTTLMSSGDHKVTINNDGDFDGELLHDNNNIQPIENSNHKHKYVEVRSQRKRRSLSVNKIPGVKTASKRGLSAKGKSVKRSDIDEDKELLQTIESIDTEMASKRGLSTNDKPLQSYMRKLAHDVRSVMGEARNVLRNTGRVVHGLKRVINGATVLTSFTNNAVKFAKYFSMEPDNATIDYLEEKAIVAVLEAQKAANEARDAANLAKIASTKARAAERRMEVARKQHKSLQKILPYIKTATRQAERAERASLYAVKNKQKTETDVMLMDKELKKMGAQLKKQNEQNPDSNDLGKTDGNRENQDAEQTASSQGDSETPTGRVKAKNNDGDYFYKKQKQLEEELKGKTKSVSSIQTLQNYASANTYKQTPVNQESPVITGNDDKNETSFSNSTVTSNLAQKNVVQKINEGPKLELYFRDNVKAQETPKLSETQPQDSAELQYIASLNKRIASIKKEEEEAKERLKAAELARNFVASTTSKMIKVPETVNANSAARSNPYPNPAAARRPFQPILNDEASKSMKASIIRTAVPEKKSKQAKHINHAKEKTFARLPKPVTVETQEYNVPNLVKKELSSQTKVTTDHSDDSTGFRKQEIIGPKLKLKMKKKQVVSSLKESKDIDKISSALSAADNNLVSEDYNPAEKRERVLYESKLLSERLKKMNSAIRGLKFNIPNNEKLAIKRHSLDSNTKKSEFAQTVNKGPITVTVAVHSAHVKNLTLNDNADKNVDLIDPFGFKNMEETNDGTISDRNVIPRPSDYYKVEYQRSFIPRPVDTHEKSAVNNGFVIDEKK